MFKQANLLQVLKELEDKLAEKDREYRSYYERDRYYSRDRYPDHDDRYAKKSNIADLMNMIRTNNTTVNNYGDFGMSILKYIFTIGSDKYLVVMSNGLEEARQMDVRPYIKNGRTMLPLRFVAEAIGMAVEWDHNTRTASFTKDGVRADIQVDGNVIRMSDGRVIVMDTKPDLSSGRTFVSIVNVAKVFNMTNGNANDGISQNIEWYHENKSAHITK